MVEDQQAFRQKADFSTIYDRPDPRDYFAALAPLDYQIPQQALPVIEAVWDAAEGTGPARGGLDVCCSYGINGALLRYDVDLDDLARYYREPADGDRGHEQVLAADRAYFAARPRRDARRVLGLDAAGPAVAYARSVGLIDDGWAVNLEDGPAPAELTAGIADVGMLVCTGGVGYVGAPTFRALLQSLGRPDDLWCAVFVLRVYDYDPITEVLDGYGLVTERLPGTFRQRRFADAAEQQAAVADVRARGLDPSGKESDGWFHAEGFVSRPRAAAQRPLTDLLSAVLPKVS